MSILVSLILISTQNSFAIGTWEKGTVTKAPWSSNYTFININNVKYTIMKDAKIVRVYSKNGAAYRDKISIYSITRGQSLLYKSEGNRIYQIERVR